jgi:hypothetical protein
MSRVEWYYPASGKGVDKSINDIVAHFPKVEEAVQVAAVKLAIDATARLAAHQKTGSAEIEIARHPKASDRTPDWYVYLRDVDPGGKWHDSTGKGSAGNIPDRSAMSIEFGWIQTHAFGKKLATPHKHEGLHILKGAMDRAAGRYRGPR